MKNIFILFLSLYLVTSKKRHKSSMRSKIRRISKKIQKKYQNQQRGLMIPGVSEPPKTTGSNVVGATSNPQISAPRLLIKNFPKPSESSYQYPQAHMVTQPQSPPLSILMPTNNTASPSPIYSPRKLKSQNPNFRNLNHRLAYKKGVNLGRGGELDDFLRKLGGKKERRLRGRKRRGRGLTVTPHMNLGPGYMDIGSNGYSPLSFAMSNPAMASMSPFVPRAGPPPPIRIQIKDSLAEHFENNFLTGSQRKVKDHDIKLLNEQIDSEFEGLKAQIGGTTDNLGTYFHQIEDSLAKLREHQKNVEKEADDMKAEILRKTNPEQEFDNQVDVDRKI